MKPFEDSGHPVGEAYGTETLEFANGEDFMEFTRTFDQRLIARRVPPTDDSKAPATPPA